MSTTPSFGTVLQHWRSTIGHVIACEALHNKQTVYAVRTDQGPLFVLKRNVLTVGAYTIGERLTAEYRVLRHLRAAHVPVAVPLLTDDHQVFVAQDGDIYTLSPLLPNGGHSTAVDVRLVYENIGAAIGRLHVALATYPGEIKSWRMDLPKRILGEAIPRVKEHLNGHQAEMFNAALADVAETLTNTLADLPEQHIHGDCHGGNILVQDDHVSGFIDLDHLPFGPKVYDLCSLLADRLKWDLSDADKRAQWLEQFTCILSGYTEENTLSTREKAAIWPGMLAVQMLMMEWFLQQEATPSVEVNAATFYYLYAHREAIEQRIVSTL